MPTCLLKQRVPMQLLRVCVPAIVFLVVQSCLLQLSHACTDRRALTSSSQDSSQITAHFIAHPRSHIVEHIVDVPVPLKSGLSMNQNAKNFAIIDCTALAGALFPATSGKRKVKGREISTTQRRKSSCRPPINVAFWEGNHSSLGVRLASPHEGAK